MSRDTLFGDHHILAMYRPEIRSAEIATFGAAGSDGANVEYQQQGKMMDFVITLSLGSGTPLHEFKGQLTVDGSTFVDVPGMTFSITDPNSAQLQNFGIRVHSDAFPKELVDTTGVLSFLNPGNKSAFRWQRKVTAAGAFSAQFAMVCVFGDLVGSPRIGNNGAFSVPGGLTADFTLPIV